MHRCKFGQPARSDQQERGVQQRLSHRKHKAFILSRCVNLHDGLRAHLRHNSAVLCLPQNLKLPFAVGAAVGLFIDPYLNFSKILIRFLIHITS